MRFLPFRLLRLQNGQRRGNVRMNSRKITRFAFFFTHSPGKNCSQRVHVTPSSFDLSTWPCYRSVISCVKSHWHPTLSSISFSLDASFARNLTLCVFFSSSTLWPVSSFIQLIGDLSELREKSYDDNGRAIASSCSSINSRQEVQSGNNQIFSLTKKKSKHDPGFPSNFNWKQMKSCKVYWVAESNLGLKSFIN